MTAKRKTAKSATTRQKAPKVQLSKALEKQEPIAPIWDVEPPTLQLPAVCPHCRSATKGQLITVTKVREMIGQVFNFPFQKVEWSKRQCDCGQLLDVRTYTRRSDG